MRLEACIMKTYKVYVDIERQEIEVEADSEDEAEDLAFEQMQDNLLLSDCTFETELIEDDDEEDD